MNARAHIPFSLTDFAGPDCCSHFGVNHLMGAHNATTENPEAGSPPSAMMRSKMLPLKLSSMDFPSDRFPEIRGHMLYNTGHAGWTLLCFKMANFLKIFAALEQDRL